MPTYAQYTSNCICYILHQSSLFLRKGLEFIASSLWCIFHCGAKKGRTVLFCASAPPSPLLSQRAPVIGCHDSYNQLAYRLFSPSGLIEYLLLFSCLFPPFYLLIATIEPCDKCLQKLELVFNSLL